MKTHTFNKLTRISLSTLIAIFFLSTFFPTPGNAQILSDNPPWDYHIHGWRFYGKMGVAVTFGNHNRRLSFISALNLDYTRVGKEKGRSEFGLPIYDNNAGWRTGVHFDFSVNRNFCLYNRRMIDKKVDIVEKQGKNSPSWTFENELGFKFGMAFHSNKFKQGLVHIDRKGLRDSRVEVVYNIRALYNTGHFRKLSNVIGEIRLNYGKADDRWNGTVSWTNDMFLFGVFGPLRRDHGVSNRVRLGLGYRPTDTTALIVNRYAIEYENIIVTDRRTGIKMYNPNSKMGFYKVMKLEKAFHNYHRFNMSMDGNYMKAMLTVGMDNLLTGRNLQRFAHQGFDHLPVNKRKKKLFRWFGGTDSPLFPWEEDPDFYKKPKYFIEAMVEGYMPVNVDPFQWK